MRMKVRIEMIKNQIQVCFLLFFVVLFAYVLNAPLSDSMKKKTFTYDFNW